MSEQQPIAPIEVQRIENRQEIVQLQARLSTLMQEVRQVQHEIGVRWEVDRGLAQQTIQPLVQEGGLK